MENSKPRGAMRPWTETEVQLVRETGSLTATEVADRLGRSPSSVAHMRTRLRADEGLTWGTGTAKEPAAVGLRPLVARTCLGCGELMDRSWFRRNQIAGCWTSTCTACRRGGRGKKELASTRERNRRSKPSKRASRERFQRATLPAARAGLEWTSADHSVLADPDQTILQKALVLGRTYNATKVALSRGGHTSRVGLGDAVEGRWKITAPEADRLLGREA